MDNAIGIHPLLAIMQALEQKHAYTTAAPATYATPVLTPVPVTSGAGVSPITGCFGLLDGPVHHERSQL